MESLPEKYDSLIDLQRVFQKDVRQGAIS